jgi:hypothetical protein
MPTVVNTNTTIGQVNIASQKATVLATYQALITGLNEAPADLQSLVIGGVTYSKAELIAQFQARIDAAKKTLAARTALHLAVVAERAEAAKVVAIRAGLKTVLQGRYGKSGAELQQYGFTPVKKTQRAALTKADAVAANLSTRAARGTKGKKQKSTIKGARPAPAHTAAPAASATATTTTANAPAASASAAKPATSNPGAIP